MNHIFIFALTLMVSLATSCTKDLEAPIPDKSNDPYVIISLEDPKMETRSFFNDNLAGESWERELHNVTVFIIRADENDNIITKRLDLSSEEIENKRSQKVTLDGAEEEEDVMILAVANFTIPAEVADYEDIMSFGSFDVDVAEYNGTFEEVTSGSVRDNGFYMEYGTSTTLEKDVTTVPILFERKVAKVALQTQISDSNFNNPDYYPGTLRIDSMEVENISNDSTFNHTQLPYLSNGFYQNLFYLNDTDSYSTIFTIYATYDIDGDFSTAEDQSVISYPFIIGIDDNGYGIGINDNFYYRASITINGLNREDVELTLSVADWEDTADQNVDIG